MVSPIAAFHALLRRAYPGNAAIAAIKADCDLRQTWKQAATAAGLDQWALAAVIARETGSEKLKGLGLPDLFALQLVPEKLASESLTVPLREEDGVLVVASAAPFDEPALQRVQFVANRRLRIMVAPPDDIDIALVNGYSRISEQIGRAHV